MVSSRSSAPSGMVTVSDDEAGAVPKTVVSLDTLPAVVMTVAAVIGI